MAKQAEPKDKMTDEERQAYIDMLRASEPNRSEGSLKRVVRRMACKCGWHEWQSDSECIESTLGKGTLVNHLGLLHPM